MSRIYVGAVLLVGLLAGGCSGVFSRQENGDENRKIIIQNSDADTILTCLASNEKMTRKDFNAAYKQTVAEIGRGEKADFIRHVCLSLNQHATYKQFKGGMDSLSTHIKEQEKISSLYGLLFLFQRIEKEQRKRWVIRNKKEGEVDLIENENKELMEKIETLEKNSVGDQGKIKELQQQIEQLKNIENIIKNRER